MNAAPSKPKPLESASRTVASTLTTRSNRQRGALLSASFSNALDAVWTNRLRSFLTMLGIIIGVSAVIAVFALVQGTSAYFNAQFSTLGVNIVTVSSGSAAGVTTILRGSGIQSPLTLSDIQALSTIAHASNVSPGGTFPAQMTYGNQSWPGTLSPVSTGYQGIGNWSLSEGAWWNTSDEQLGTPVVLLGQTVVSNTFAATGVDPIGQTIHLNGQPYRVIGVLASKGQQNGEDLDNIALVPYTTYLRSTGQTSVGDIMVQADSAATLTQVQQDVTALLTQRHHISPGGTPDFHTTTSTQLIQAQEKNNNALELLLISIAAISLVVGGIGIMNIMLVSVTERIREIGLHLAVGAFPSDIRSQFLIESITLCAIGGAIAIPIGLVIGFGLTRVFQFPFVFNVFAILLAFGIAAFVGIVFGFYPALRASKLDPIEALRME